MFYCCETGFFTFKTEVNGMWLLLFLRVMVLMLERYGCPLSFCALSRVLVMQKKSLLIPINEKLRGEDINPEYC